MFRNLLMMLMFAASLVHAAWSDYEETRDLSLDGGGIEALQIEAGAGSLEVTGVSGIDRIVVRARIRVPDVDATKARDIISDSLVLTLERSGNTADLRSFFRSGIRGLRNSPMVDLEVELPDGLTLSIDDGSGSIEVRNVSGDIQVVDGSGSIQMADVGGNLDIRDGSGSITIERAGGDVTIRDGSGSIDVADVRGTVTINDGSGSIDVRDVDGDLDIVANGSGSLNFSRVAGRVSRPN